MKINYALVVLDGLLLTGCNGVKNHAQFETASVARSNLVQYATATGSLGAVVTVDVGSQISGRITALHADYNSAIKKGELLATDLYGLFLSKRSRRGFDLGGIRTCGRDF